MIDVEILNEIQLTMSQLLRHTQDMINLYDRWEKDAQAEYNHEGCNQFFKEINRLIQDLALVLEVENNVQS